MDELTRFARRLAEQLGAGEAAKRPVTIAAIRESILPYRSQRKALALESAEDYELVLLRLAAEERGYVKTLPPEAAARCREEVGAANPDLGVLDVVADATIQLTSLAVGRTVLQEGAADPPPSPSPPTMPVPPPTPEPPAARTAAPAPPAEGADHCRHCRNPVPTGRQVVFCPWCGQRLIPFTCARCGTELDSEWRHCITCGAAAKDPFRYV
ncbi:MAG: hypothetical protein HOP28_13075 [Gemmatimonadales bacterium]|nr:hypothetical protein [Gemmatimonadales bacterium]